METNLTDANAGKTPASLTDALPNFDLTSLEKVEAKSPDEIEAERKTKETADLAATEEAKKLADEAAAKSDETFFEFEDKKFKLDNKGNALKEDGTIFKTKEELAKLTTSEVTDDLTIIDETTQLLGAQILGEDNKPKVYEDSVKGIAEFAKDYARQEVDNSQRAFFKQFPQVQEFARHIANGGKEEDFYKAKTASWENISIDEENEAQQVDIITKDLLNKGHSKEEAADLITLYKDSKKVLEKSKVALESHRKNDATKKAQDIEKAKADTLAYNQRVDNHWKAVDGAIQKGELKNITIPENEKEGFFKYIATAIDKEGNSQYDIDESNDEIESDLEYKYLRYKKFDLSSIIKRGVATSKATSLKDRLTKEKKDNNNGSGNTTKEVVEFTKVASTDISVASIFE